MSEEKPQNAETSAPESSQPEIQAFSVKRVHRTPRVSFGWVNPVLSKLRPAYGWARKQWKFTVPALVLVLALGGWGIWHGLSQLSPSHRSSGGTQYGKQVISKPADPSAPAPGHTVIPSKEQQNAMAHTKRAVGTVKTVSATQLTIQTSDGKTSTFKLTPKTQYYDYKTYVVRKFSDMKPGQRASFDYTDTTKEVGHVWFD